MASIQVNFPTVTGAISNRFVVRMLDADNQTIGRFQQDQTIFVVGITNPTILTIAVPDGTYSYDYLKIRIYNDSPSSGIYTDIITTLQIDCSPGTVTPTTVAPTTIVPTTVQQTTLVQSTINTTVGSNPCSCNGVATFEIVYVNNQYVQFVSTTPVTQNVNGQTTTGTHRITYNSCGVNKIVYAVYSQTGILAASGTIIPTTNTFLVDLSAVPAGSYTFVLTSVVTNGSGCSGVDKKPFTISAVQTTIAGPTTTFAQQTTSNSDLDSYVGAVPVYTNTVVQGYHTDKDFLDVDVIFNGHTFALVDKIQTVVSGNNKLLYAVDNIFYDSLDLVPQQAYDYPIYVQKFITTKSADRPNLLNQSNLSGHAEHQFKVI